MKLIKLFFVFLITFHLYSLDSSNQKHYIYSIKLRVSSIESSRANIIKKTENFNGYVKNINNNYMELVIPQNEILTTYLNDLKKMGVLLEEKLSSEDYSENLITLETQIRVKQKYYEDLKKMIEESNFTQTLEMETELFQVISEMENLKGEYNYLKFLTQTATLKLSFVTYQETSLPSIIVPGWVQSIGIFNFTERFHEK